jgi:four helix bundle protein
MINNYKDLKFWQTAKDVSLKVIILIKKLPNERVFWVIEDQILRSSFSVGANITEGFGRYKGKEYQRFLLIALGSANETEYWLELLKDLCPNIISDIEIIINKNKETIRMLVATLKTLRSKK